jgi:hypothetical protein
MIRQASGQSRHRKSGEEKPDAVAPMLPVISATIEVGSTPKQIIECCER